MQSSAVRHARRGADFAFELEGLVLFAFAGRSGAVRMPARPRPHVFGKVMC